MEERQTRIDEKPATYRRKGQLYLIVSVGLIMMFLLINTVYNVISHGKKAAVPDAPQPQSTATDNNPARFKSLLDDHKNDVATTGPGIAVKKSPFDVVLPDSTALRGNGEASGSNSDTDKDKKDLIGDVQMRFKAQEVERALKARQTRYADSGEAITRPSAAAGHAPTRQPPAAGSSAKNTNAARVAELAQQRSGLQSRIHQMTTQGAEPAALTAAKAALAAQRTLARGRADNPSPANPAVPEGVVGFAADNAYQASTEGKIKLPVGSEINAITTYTAISDYAGGSMKAMVTHDVYDATNSIILAPKGSQFLIKAVKASGVNEVIQSRLAFTVQWLVLPNGDRIDFRKASVLDRMGTPAVEGDEVDRHLMAQILGVTAYALIGTQTSYEGTGDGNESFAGNFGEGARGQAGSSVQKYLQIVPTVTLHAGAPVRIITEDEMFITPWKVLYASYVN